jgi:ClpX C4-type zinc finger
VNCPICAQALEGGELVMVCNHCHKALGGGLSVNATGEFRIPSAAELDAHADHMPTDAPSPGERVHSVNVCSWCGKLEAQVKKLLGRGNAALCDECVSLASDILDAELGANWR